MSDQIKSLFESLIKSLEQSGMRRAQWHLAQHGYKVGGR